MNTRRTRGITIVALAVLLAAACWGSSGVFIKFLVADSGISALALAFWRDFLTFLILFISLSI